MDHLSGRERKVAPRREGLRVDHGQTARVEVGHQVAGAGREAGAAGLDSLVQGGGV